MAKRTSVAALAGRVIESVTIFHDDVDGNENPVSLEIRCVGGKYFSFSLTANVTARGVACLADNATGELRGRINRAFEAKGTVPYAPDEED